MPKYIPTKIIEKKQISDVLFQFKLEKVFDFRAGQFMAIKVIDGLKRYYSLASSPKDSYFELLIDTSPGGPGSKFFERLKEGQSIEVLGPLGQFVFEASANVVFVCTGTGLAPCLSMLKDQLGKGNTNKLFLLFGTRLHQNILKLEELTLLKEKYPNFDFKVTLTQPEVEWAGAMGRVTEHLEEFDPAADYYICGIKDMIKSVVELLEQKGVEKEQIHFEQY